MPFFEGLDPGKKRDPAALAIVEQKHRVNRPVYAVRHMERWPLGTPYTRLVEEVCITLRRPPLVGSILVVDQTGVGEPVVDLFRRACPPVTIHGILATSGNEAKSKGPLLTSVPKRVLAMTLKVVLQTGRLEVASSLALARPFLRELEAYTVRVRESGHETFGAEKDTDRDDLVSAVANAIWVAEHMPTIRPGDIGLARGTQASQFKHAPRGVFS